MLGAVLLAAGVSFLATPLVKLLAYKVGAVDVPKDNRRMHKVPIPRLGGLAIFIAFMFSVLIFAQIDTQTKGILLGATIIVVSGRAGRYHGAAGAAEIRRADRSRRSSSCCMAAGSNVSPTRCPARRQRIWQLPEWLSVTITIIWIVAITNAVNFIDGLDGLAVGVSGISAGDDAGRGAAWSRRTISLSLWRRCWARAWALSRIILTRPKFSWATPARPFWALSWRRSPSRGCSSSMPSSRLPCRS